MSAKGRIPVSGPREDLQSPFAGLSIPDLPEGVVVQEKKQPPASPGRVVLRKEKSGRGGKPVIVVSGFHAGISAGEIAFIQDYETDEAKLNLFRAVRSGRVRILFGSTQKMGTGANVQERLIALHHLDAPWRPADVEQWHRDLPGAEQADLLARALS